MQNVALISNSPDFSWRPGGLIQYQKNLSSWWIWAVLAPDFLQHCTTACVPSWPPKLSPGFWSLSCCFLPWILQVTKICLTALHLDTKPPHRPTSPSEDVSPALLPMVNLPITFPCAAATRGVPSHFELVLVHRHTAYVSAHCLSLVILGVQLVFHFISSPSDIHHGFSIRNSCGN